MVKNEFRIDGFLTAAECDAQQEMSLPTLVQRIIDIATAHANHLNVGYARLLAENHAWVLSRLSIEMKRYPRVNENYSIVTWVENVNRHYSERNMAVFDDKGENIGYVRTIWVAIDITTRRPADLTSIMTDIPSSDRPCPIDKMPRLGALADPDTTREHVFRFCDIDFNRHVNSTRYIEAMLNQWNVEFFDKNFISRFDVTYMAEAHAGERVEICRKSDGVAEEVAIVRGETLCTRARIKFSQR